MAHLHAILATESHAAILIKRGPGRCSATIGWDRRSDTFEPGQWLKQKIYHDVTDLSPDGELFTYFVNTQRYGVERSVYRAISKRPWLKALAFWSNTSWPMGPGPGMFFRDADQSLKLWAMRFTAEWDHIGIDVVHELPKTPPWDTFMKDSLHIIRLQRDGWIPVTAFEKCSELEAKGAARWRQRQPHRMILVKPLAHGWSLRQTHWCGLHNDQNRGISWESFMLVSPGGEVTPQPDWEWAHVDPDRNRLVWTAGCKLFGAGVSSAGIGTARLLLDTGTMSFEPHKAPY